MTTDQQPNTTTPNPYANNGNPSVNVNVINQSNDAPVKAGWWLIIITAILYMLPPFISWGGGFINFVGLIISIVILAKGETGQGIVQLLINLLVLPFWLVVMWFVYGAGFLLLAASQNGAAFQ